MILHWRSILGLAGGCCLKDLSKALHVDLTRMNQKGYDLEMHKAIIDEFGIPRVKVEYKCSTTLKVLKAFEKC